mmetsp:Transcript_8584/g.14436  ORF Transcript_8584/g.14436 Transcript_8584/m.14436 type:complete len:221 (-) Transcript_8584:13-675(-)
MGKGSSGVGCFTTKRNCTTSFSINMGYVRIGSLGELTSLGGAWGSVCSLFHMRTWGVTAGIAAQATPIASVTGVGQAALAAGRDRGLRQATVRLRRKAVIPSIAACIRHYLHQFYHPHRQPLLLYHRRHHVHPALLVCHRLCQCCPRHQRRLHRHHRCQQRPPFRHPCYLSSYSSSCRCRRLFCHRKHRTSNHCRLRVRQILRPSRTLMPPVVMRGRLPR